MHVPRHLAGRPLRASTQETWSPLAIDLHVPEYLTGFMARTEGLQRRDQGPAGTSPGKMATLDYQGTHTGTR